MTLTGKGLLACCLVGGLVGCLVDWWVNQLVEKFCCFGLVLVGPKFSTRKIGI